MSKDRLRVARTGQRYSCLNKMSEILWQLTVTPFWLNEDCHQEVPLSQVPAKQIMWAFWIFANLHPRPEIWAFKNGLTISGTFVSILRQIWLLFFLNIHGLANKRCNWPRYFFYRNFNSWFQAWLIRFQNTGSFIITVLKWWLIALKLRVLVTF